MSFIGLSVPLSGTYTINSSIPTGGTNYSSFSSATADLIANGVSGPVTFLVKQGTYTEQISISLITGSSSMNTIRFVADPTNTLPAEIAFNSATSAATNYVVQFNGTSFIQFDSLTLSSSTGTSYGTVIDFSGLNELSHAERFSVYPNPNQGEFQLMNKHKSGVFEVTLLDTKGRIVFSENTYFQSNESKKYMLNKVSKRIYIILIQDETNIEQYRIMVQ